MTRRLTRLLGIRTIRLRATGRALAKAAAAADVVAAMASQIAGLRATMAPLAGAATGYRLKAAATTRDALATADRRQGERLADAERTRTALADDVRRQRAATDAIDRAIARDKSEPGR